MSDDIAAVAKWIAKPVYLLAHSYGAVCGLEASLHIDNLKKLILYEPPLPVGKPLHPREIVDRIRACLANDDRDGAFTIFGFQKMARLLMLHMVHRCLKPNKADEPDGGNMRDLS